MMRILTREDNIPLTLINEVSNLLKTNNTKTNIAAAFINLNGLKIIRDVLNKSNETRIVTSNITEKAYRWLMRVKSNNNRSLSSTITYMQNYTSSTTTKTTSR
jgi:NAD dependent epimerase/dehydratase family enzyme